jgi:hypothetical protein
MEKVNDEFCIKISSSTGESITGIKLAKIISIFQFLKEHICSLNYQLMDVAKDENNMQVPTMRISHTHAVPRI